MVELSPIPELIEDLRHGRFVIMVDDPDRENEGDIFLAAEFATPERINFMRKVSNFFWCS